jgi:L-alanine-DL-glutamate epimerase-like enolase superfamily enzyme
VATYDAVKDLPLTIEGYELEPLEQEVAANFTLKRTVVVLRGGGFEGRGEEVDYDPRAQEQFQARRGELPFAGRHTLDSFSVLQSGQGEYRRWAFESAALDLALKQAGLSLAEALGRQMQPLTFVVSTRIANVEPWLEVAPLLRFKLDPDKDWGEDVIERLSTRGCVDTCDFKGVYRADFGSPPDAALYTKIARAFPEAWLEDPALTPETTEALAEARDRITWDAAIHEWSDVEALPFPPQCLNSKPSRFGSVRRLFHFYDACDEHGIALYGGGQFELGPGRDQIQALASIFHPDAPNDVAPSGYNVSRPTAGLPQSPLELSPSPGF